MKQFNLEEYLKNPSRKVVTGSGKDVRIICIDAKSGVFRPIITLVEEPNGSERIVTYTNEGHYYLCEPSKVNDLFFAPEKHEGWVNIYKGNNFYYTEDELVYNSKKEAEIQGKNYMSYIDTVKVEWEE